MRSINNIIHDLYGYKNHSTKNSTGPGQQFNQNFKKKRTSEFDFLALIEAWPDIVGERMAKQTHPKQNKNKVLTVITKHPAYAEQLSLLAPMIIEKIINFFPALSGQIQKIVFHTNPIFFQEIIQKKTELLEKKQLTTLHPQSPEFKKLEKEAQQFLDDIKEVSESPELRETLYSIYIQMHGPSDKNIL